MKTEVSLSALCARLAEDFLSMHNNKGVRFVWTVEPGISVHGDATLLSQVVTNLLENAQKYASSESPRVRLRLLGENGFARLSVENTHPPLPSEIVDRLFEPYFRHEQKIGSGVGLGLPIVRNIVTLHNGQIRAENFEDGIRFLVLLPLKRE